MDSSTKLSQRKKYYRVSFTIPFSLQIGNLDFQHSGSYEKFKKKDPRKIFVDKAFIRVRKKTNSFIFFVLLIKNVARERNPSS